MRSINRMILLIVALAVLLLAAFNGYMLLTDEEETGRPYRVEALRLARQMEEGESPDLSECEYVTAVVPVDSLDGLSGGGGSFIVCKVGESYYRFDYRAERSAPLRALIPANAAIVAITVMAVALALYIRRQIIKPFNRLSSVPFELSKGNLSVGLRESKSRYFGRFVWGMDMLRENIEQQRKRELELQREKKTLVLSLSHDLKTPLSAIKLYAKALERNLYEGEEKRKQIAVGINARADEMEGYISRIIKASSEDFLRLEVKNGEFYLSELLGSVKEYYDDKLALLRIGFNVGSFDDCLIFGDADRAVEVIENLMENAVKYGDGGEISISVSDEEGCRLVSVENTGCTLPENELPHIFDSFWRGSNAAAGGGSGLGLHICRRLMQHMNGDIFAQINGGRMTVTAVFRKA